MKQTISVFIQVLVNFNKVLLIHKQHYSSYRSCASFTKYILEPCHHQYLFLYTTLCLLLLLEIQSVSFQFHIFTQVRISCGEWKWWELTGLSYSDFKARSLTSHRQELCLMFYFWQTPIIKLRYLDVVLICCVFLLLVSLTGSLWGSFTPRARTEQWHK